MKDKILSFIFFTLFLCAVIVNTAYKDWSGPITDKVFGVHMDTTITRVWTDPLHKIYRNDTIIKKIPRW